MEKFLKVLSSIAFWVFIAGIVCSMLKPFLGLAVILLALAIILFILVLIGYLLLKLFKKKSGI